MLSNTEMKFTEKLGNFFSYDSHIHQEKHLSLLCVYVFMFLITFLLLYLSTFETKQLSPISLHFIVNR